MSRFNVFFLFFLSLSLSPYLCGLGCTFQEQHRETNQNSDLSQRRRSGMGNMQLCFSSMSKGYEEGHKNKQEVWPLQPTTAILHKSSVSVLCSQFTTDSLCLPAPIPSLLPPFERAANHTPTVRQPLPNQETHCFPHFFDLPVQTTQLPAKLTAGIQREWRRPRRPSETRNPAGQPLGANSLAAQTSSALQTLVRRPPFLYHLARPIGDWPHVFIGRPQE